MVRTWNFHCRVPLLGEELRSCKLHSGVAPKNEWSLSRVQHPGVVGTQRHWEKPLSPPSLSDRALLSDLLSSSAPRDIFITWWLLSHGILETLAQKSHWMGNLDRCHSRGLHDQPSGVGTKKRTSGKTREAAAVRVQLHEQAVKRHWVSHHLEHQSRQKAMQPLWEGLEIPQIQYQELSFFGQFWDKH